MLPKYVSLLYARGTFIVLGDPLVAYECRHAYELFSWLLNHGYVKVGSNMWERTYAARA